MKPMSKADVDLFTVLYIKKGRIEKGRGQLNRALRNETIDAEKYHERMRQLDSDYDKVIQQLKEIRSR